MDFSQEQINNWYKHKSNKERWIEEQERKNEIQEPEKSTEKQQRYIAFHLWQNGYTGDVTADYIENHLTKLEAISVISEIKQAGSFNQLEYLYNHYKQYGDRETNI
jgi:hypothetical protein